MITAPAVVRYKTVEGVVYGILAKITKARAYIVLASNPDRVKKVPVKELEFMEELDGAKLNKAKVAIRKYARTMHMKLPKNVREILRG